MKKVQVFSKSFKTESIGGMLAIQFEMDVSHYNFHPHLMQIEFYKNWLFIYYSSDLYPLPLLSPSSPPLSFFLSISMIY